LFLIQMALISVLFLVINFPPKIQYTFVYIINIPFPKPNALGLFKKKKVEWSLQEFLLGSFVFLAKKWLSWNIWFMNFVGTSCLVQMMTNMHNYNIHKVHYVQNINKTKKYHNTKSRIGHESNLLKEKQGMTFLLVPPNCAYTWMSLWVHSNAKPKYIIIRLFGMEHIVYICQFSHNSLWISYLFFYMVTPRISFQLCKFGKVMTNVSKTSNLIKFTLENHKPPKISKQLATTMWKFAPRKCWVEHSSYYQV
jgi:hypothetical protein